MMTEYHNPNSCNKCSGENKIISESYEQGSLSEAKTKCSFCGFEDYWAFGFFQSGSEMISKCETYNFDSSSYDDWCTSQEETLPTQ